MGVSHVCVRSALNKYVTFDPGSQIIHGVHRYFISINTYGDCVL